MTKKRLLIAFVFLLIIGLLSLIAINGYVSQVGDIYSKTKDVQPK